MHNSNIPSDQELPSSGKLIKSTILAVIAAVVLLVAFVMPAEYGVDPTGIGKLTGLKKMGEIKMSLAAEIEADASTIEPERVEPEQVEPVVEKVTEAVSDRTENNNLSTDGILSHEMTVTLAPDEATEIKVALRKGKRVEYSWWTDGGAVNFDVHADSKALDISYHNYSKGSAQKSDGVIEAEFDGYHGWFWRNRTGATITITLQTKGEYTEIKEL